MATKPTNLAEWATDVGAPVVEPSTPQKQAGWSVSFKPPAQWFNWWMELVHLWVVWLDAFESEAHTWTGLQTFSNATQFNSSINVVGTSNLSSVSISPGGVFQVLKKASFDIAAGETPMLDRAQTASTPFLLFEQPVDGARKLRVYVKVNLGLVVTYNARYVAAGNEWARDVTSNAYMFAIGRGLQEFQAPVGGGSPFADAAWESIFSTFDPVGSGRNGIVGEGHVWYGLGSTGLVTTGRHIPQPAWTNLTLSANLTPDVLFPPQHYRDTTGRVWFRGYATANTTIASGAQIGTLPHAIERYQTNVLLVGGGASHSGLVSMVLQPSTNRIDLQNWLGGGNVTAGMLIPFENLSYRSV